MTTEKDHGEANASGWASTIAEYVAALECDYDRLDELQPLAIDGDITIDDAAELAILEDAATIDGELQKDADSVRERIQECPLSVEFRSGWYAPGADHEAEEFMILLSTGGPALRIMGELDEHMQPSRAWLEYQDWGTPWAHFYVKDFSDTLLTFCQQFYFGE